MIQKPLISVIIPLHNEAENVLKLHEQIIKALERFDHEIIYVDDGSQDQTLQHLKQITTPVSVLKLSKRSGQSAALLTGIRHAVAPYIATIDGDLQNDPLDIPRLFKKLRSSPYEMIIGYRDNRQDSILKIWPSRVINLIFKCAFNIPVNDMGCGLKVMTTSLALSLPLQRGMHRFLALNALRLGAKISEEKVNHRPRKFGHSKYNIERIPEVINDVFFIYCQSFNPHHKSRQIWNIFLLLLNVFNLFGIWHITEYYMISKISLWTFLLGMVLFGLLFYLICWILKASIVRYSIPSRPDSTPESSFILIK